MIKYIKNIIILWYLVVPFISYSQTDNNLSFVGKYWFSRDIGTGIYGVTGTEDGGFAFISGFGGMIKTDSSQYRFCSREESIKYADEYDKLPPSYDKEKSMPYTKDIPIYKCKKDGTIEWANKFYAGGLGCNIKQTKERGYICRTRGIIVKLDSLGNTEWSLDFAKDSIPNIKKTEFLRSTGASDVTECSDGSFIALLNASFSLLKISKEGKPLWLKSTLFDEYNPYVYQWFDNRYCENCYYAKKDANYNGIKGVNSSYFRISSYHMGGGVYIPTFEVFETDDGGYMALGRSDYRDKSYVKKIEKTSPEFKNYYIEKIENPYEAQIINNISRVYENTKEPMFKNTDYKWGSNSLVKTDKDGNVLWTKQFGEYNWGNDNLSGHSDLIKLANGKWLIRIRDCHKIRENTFPDSSLNYTDWSASSSRIFIIDNNGNTLKEQWIGDNAYNFVLAADSGYFANRAYDVTKYDKNLKKEWSQGTDVTTRAYSSPMMSATADSGVVCDGGGGYIIKIDKYGHAPSNDFTVSVSTNADTAFFKRHLQGMKNRNAKLIIKPIQLEFREEKFNKETGYSYEYKTREVRKKDIIKMIFLNDQFAYFLRGNRYDNNFGNYRKEIKLQVEEGTLKEYPEEYFHTYPVLPGKKKDLPQKPSYKQLTPEESRLNIANEGYEFVLDLNDKLQLNNLIIEALYGNYIECEFGGSCGIVVTDLGTGTYEYEVQGEKNEIIASGKFEIKEKKK